MPSLGYGLHLVEMDLAPHAPFGTLVMAYILVEMHLAPHVFFGTLAMVYILVKMHLAHNNILDVSFVT